MATYEEVPAVVRGAESKDAAVTSDAAGPDSDAFLPPVNAGLADPHGPLVVSPSIHGTGPGPIVPGPVTVERQTEVETEVARRVLVENEPVPAVTADVAPSPPSTAEVRTESGPDPSAAQEAAKSSAPRRAARKRK